MTNEEAIGILKEKCTYRDNSRGICCNYGEDYEAFDMAIKALEQTRWIPVKTRNITDEEREKEDYPKEWHSILECKMPEEGEEILVTIKGHKENYVEKDTAYNDWDGWYLDGGYDWGEDVIAWMPLPEPYKAESEVAE